MSATASIARVTGFLAAAAGAAMLAAAPAPAQIRPDPPGTAEVVRLREPRIAPLPESQWTAEHRARVDRYAPEVRIGNAFRTLLHVPELVDAVMPFLLYATSGTTLPARHRELLILRTAWLARSRPLWADHAPTARIVGLTAEDMRRIAEGPAAPGWTPFEATLLRLADELYRNSSVRDAVWAALEERYDLLNLVDAVMTVNQTTLLAMLLNSFGVQPDDDALARWPADVPYRLDVADPEPPLREPRVAPLEGPGIRVGPHLRAPSPDAGGAARAVRLREPRLALTPLLPRTVDPAHRLELPGRLRVGEARGQRGPRPRPRSRPGADRPRAGRRLGPLRAGPRAGGRPRSTGTVSFPTTLGRRWRLGTTSAR